MFNYNRLFCFGIDVKESRNIEKNNRLWLLFVLPNKWRNLFFTFFKAPVGTGYGCAGPVIIVFVIRIKPLKLYIRLIFVKRIQVLI